MKRMEKMRGHRSSTNGGNKGRGKKETIGFLSQRRETEGFRAKSIKQKYEM